MQRILSGLCQYVPCLGVHLDTKQILQEPQLYPLHAFQGCFRTLDAPDLTALAQYVLHMRVKEFGFQNESFAVDICIALQKWLFCGLAEVLNGRAQSLGAMHHEPQVFEPINLLNDVPIEIERGSA